MTGIGGQCSCQKFLFKNSDNDLIPSNFSSSERQTYMENVQKQKTPSCEVVLQEYGLTITKCYLCTSLPTNMPWHQSHNDPISPHAFICALSQVKDKHNDAMSVGSLARKLQFNMTHTLLGLFVDDMHHGWNLSILWDLMFSCRLLSSGLLCHVIWYNSTIV